MTCPAEHELARALSCGPDDATSAHLAACTHCRAAWDGFARAIELARELPADVPPPAHREEVRTALLASVDAVARPTRRASRLVWIGVGVAAAATAALSLWHSAPAGPHTRASLHPSPGASYALASDPPDEIVRLRDGALAIDVDALDPADRFRVVVGDTEIEVRGTSFDVTAQADQLVGVRVAHGRVEVRPPAGAPTMLGAGQSWHRPLATRAPATQPTSPAAPGPATSPSTPSPSSASPGPTPSTPPSRVITSHAAPSRQVTDAQTTPDRTRTSPEELAYNEAWNALRASDFRKAALGFARVVALSPAGPLADDAAYWRAVSLARGARPAEATAAFRELLDEYPNSPRAGEASVMLGWLLVDANQLDEAERRFRAAASDASDAVRASARSGLDALANKRR